jgi:peptide/nickel transport system permease protein
MLLMLAMGSMVSFLVITLPPGDYISAYLDRITIGGANVSQEELVALRAYYGLNDPEYVQYVKWMSRVLRGDLGRSFGWNRPVAELILERLPMTMLLSFGALVVTYAIAIPVGIYSAVKQYSLGDYAATSFGFIGLSIPNFLLALVAMMLFHNLFGLSVGGLFSPEYAPAPWSVGSSATT